MPQSGPMDRSRHRLTAHLKSVLGKEAYLPWILNQSQPNVGPRRDFLSIFFKFPLDFILVLCRRERGVRPIRGFAPLGICDVPARLRLSACATSVPVHRASSIAVPDFAHFFERLRFYAEGPFAYASAHQDKKLPAD
jgi:hypothetical protein